MRRYPRLSIVFLSLALAVGSAFGQSVTNIRPQLVGKTAVERASIKSAVFRDLVSRPGRYTSQNHGVSIEILDVRQINGGGISVLARAWKLGGGGGQYGFGPDGTIDIERFRIYNPPILVDDPSGDIVRDDGVVLREDPVAALVEVIAHNTLLVGHLNTQIVKDSIGHTTDTFYPDANPETNSVDGYVYRSSSGTTFSLLHNAVNGSGSADSGTAATAVELTAHASTSDDYTMLLRSIFGFNTASIGSDTISSATFSVRGSGKSDAMSQSVCLDHRSAPISATALANGDFDYTNYDATDQASRIAIASWNTGGYNDFALNATGISNVNTSGISWFSLRISSDLDNSAPTWSAGADAFAFIRYADYTGTSTDPKLVVVHSAVSATTDANFFGGD